MTEANDGVDFDGRIASAIRVLPAVSSSAGGLIAAGSF
jgi:hypothetical protein